MTSETATPSKARGNANAALTAALAITAIAAATLAGAWFFQLVLDIRPCPLCLEQRYAYYLAVPLGALVALGSAGNLLQRLDSVKVIRCDEVQWRFLGVSLAGYNVLISLSMAGIAAWAAIRSARRS